MKKFIFCISLVLAGLMTACVEKNQAVDEDSKPSWLGESIYQELKNPQTLEGTFNTYLRLIDDLGYAETLNRTGSKTIFPANDEAFNRFFQSNPWGVTSYEKLSNAQKKMLLYSSMLDNALLVSMLSNVSNTSSTESQVSQGIAMKHQTNLNVIDTVQCLTSDAQMPQNNRYWDAYRNQGNMYVVNDATRPMMVHFTREHLLNNDITTLGDESDFAILTGNPYSENLSAYIFDNAIINRDITCQNGYIHQMQDVIVPPGNMAQVLRSDDETTYFSHILDYFCAPYENAAVTSNYNAWAQENGRPTIDHIYEVRYLNNKAGHRQNTDPDGNIVSSTYLADVATMFVPTNKAMVQFFCQGGDGAYLIDLYGKYHGSENNEAHLLENLDALHNTMPEILTAFINNLMKSSFTATVPSKFETVQNDANEYMGITLDKIDEGTDKKYDIQMANNGVIYKMKELIARDEYQSVMAPSSVYPDMKVFNWAIKEPDSDQPLNVQFRYYLMSMSSNFAFFIPDSAAFENYYIDPCYLGHSEPRALKFFYDTTGSKATVHAKAYRYDPVTNTIGDVMNGGANVEFAQWQSLMVDILNYHTVVLNEGETLGTNKYYKTKHGGEIMVTGGNNGDKVMSGQQIDNGVTAATIKNVYSEKNGTAYRIDHVIQAPRNSVSKTLESNSRFSEFYNLCSGFGASDLLEWAGISGEKSELGTTEQDAYIIFQNQDKDGHGCLDYNVKMFNTYNYTLYAPNNDAMKKAYDAGLPTWDQVQKLYETYANDESAAATAAKERAKAMINQMRDFAHYHFQSNSVYADNVVAGGRFNSLCTDNLGLALELRVSGGNGQLTVTDGAGKTHTIDANNSAMLSNLMTRDYWFNRARAQATAIYTSSFCVIHELSEALDSGQ